MTADNANLTPFPDRKFLRETCGIFCSQWKEIFTDASRLLAKFVESQRCAKNTIAERNRRWSCLTNDVLRSWLVELHSVSDACVDGVKRAAESSGTVVHPTSSDDEESDDDVTDRPSDDGGSLRSSNIVDSLTFKGCETVASELVKFVKKVLPKITASEFAAGLEQFASTCVRVPRHADRDPVVSRILTYDNDGERGSNASLMTRWLLVSAVELVFSPDVCLDWKIGASSVLFKTKYYKPYQTWASELEDNGEVTFRPTATRRFNYLKNETSPSNMKFLLADFAPGPLTRDAGVPLYANANPAAASQKDLSLVRRKLRSFFSPEGDKVSSVAETVPDYSLCSSTVGVWLVPVSRDGTTYEELASASERLFKFKTFEAMEEIVAKAKSNRSGHASVYSNSSCGGGANDRTVSAFFFSFLPVNTKRIFNTVDLTGSSAKAIVKDASPTGGCRHRCGLLEQQFWDEDDLSLLPSSLSYSKSVTAHVGKMYHNVDSTSLPM